MFSGERLLMLLGNYIIKQLSGKEINVDKLWEDGVSDY